jgi:hypothetical protein
VAGKRGTCLLSRIPLLSLMRYRECYNRQCFVSLSVSSAGRRALGFTRTTLHLTTCIGSCRGPRLLKHELEVVCLHTGQAFASACKRWLASPWSSFWAFLKVIARLLHQMIRYEYMYDALWVWVLSSTIHLDQQSQASAPRHADSMMSISHVTSTYSSRTVKMERWVLARCPMIDCLCVHIYNPGA